MEGLLGGLVKDKDPRAEIVRAELDAMAREAEMTGLKLRRSKAYEEINHAMGGSSSSSSASTQNGINGAGSRASGSGSKPIVPASSSSSSSLSSIRPQPPQNLQQLQPAPAYPQHQRPAHPKLEPRPHAGPGQVQSGPGYHPRSLPGSPSHGPHRQPPPLQSSVSHGSSSAYHPYDMGPRHSQNPQSHRPQHPSNLNSANTYAQNQHHTQPSSHPPSHQPYPPSYSSPSFGHHSNNMEGVQSTYNNPGSHNHGRTQSSEQIQYRNEAKPSSHMSVSSNGTYKNGMNGSTGHFSINRGNNFQASQRIVTHRPSLAAHQLSDPMTGYMAIPQVNLEKDNALILPTVEVMDHLLEMHFRSIHPVIPFLHYKTINDQIHRNESPPPHLLFAIFGLASRFSDNPAFRIPRPGEERPPSAIFYERARHFIRDEFDNAQVATIQSLLLMAIQQMGFCESQRAWLYIGMAIRIAQDLGLNKEPSDQEKSRNPLLCEIRKRTWWSCYVLDRFVGQGLSRPLTISHGECEASFPQIEDEEVDLVSGRSISIPTISNFGHMIRLSKIQGEILEFIQAKFAPFPAPKSVFADCPRNGVEQDRKIPVDTSAAAFAALDKALTTWRSELPEELQNPTAQSPSCGLYLHLTYNTLIILLHRPEIPNSPTSSSLCTQAAVTISDITEILMETKALASIFISCLYAIFSAGVIHFMNIPSVKRPNLSNTSSPVLDSSSSSQGPMSSSTKSAKTNLKRCIDALKFLASHWISAARRAKVLEDLLDLKHVSLKDLEVDTFKMSPVAPPWVLEDTKYKEVLVAPREGHDKLRQQCRSKVMAIHSLLVNDDDFQKLQRKRSFSTDEEPEDLEDEATNGDREESSKLESKDSDMDLDQKSKESGSENVKASDELTVSVTSPAVSRPIGLGVQSPVSSSTAASSPTSVRTEGSQRQSSESDPVMVVSTAKLGLSDSPAVRASSNSPFAGLRPADVLSAAASGLVRHECGMLTPMTMTTLQSTSPLLGPKSPNDSVGSSVSSGSVGGRQGAMLDPFSMPSSINFPDLDRRPSTSGAHNGANGVSNGTTTIWSTDASTNRSTARSAASSPMLSKSPAAPQAATPAEPLTQRSELVASSSGDVRARTEQEEQDLVWNDMPPTLGLDEWAAYIGAMMMKWLASGQSSPRSTMSS
ncbi:hypothetical protein BG005_009139 [Podila minutissima]|nr:hypothetical protein BG005_009139 [Podila minutissima]